MKGNGNLAKRINAPLAELQIRMRKPGFPVVFTYKDNDEACVSITSKPN
jgi:hypothetical protein